MESAYSLYVHAFSLNIYLYITCMFFLILFIFMNSLSCWVHIGGVNGTRL